MNYRQLLSSGVFRFCTVALCYFLAGRFSLLLSMPPGYATAFYPAAGLALGAMLTYGLHAIPGVFVGALAFCLSVSFERALPFNMATLSVAMVLSMVAVLQAGLAGWLIQSRQKQAVTLDSNKEIAVFFLFSAVAAAAGTTADIGILRILGQLTRIQSDTNWLVWWVGDTLGMMIAAPVWLLFAGQPHQLWRSRRYKVLIPLSACILIVVIAFVFIRDRERDKQALEFRLEAQRMSQNVQSRLNHHAMVLDYLERLFASSNRVSQHEFAVFSEHALRDFPGISYLAWVPYVAPGAASAFEQTLNKDEFPGWRILPPAAKADTTELQRGNGRAMYPVLYLTPLNHHPDLPGRNLALQPASLHAIESARDSGETKTTPPSISGAGKQADSVSLFAPVYQNGRSLMNTEERRTAFTGVVTASFRLADILHETLSETEEKEFHLRFFDKDFPDGQSVFMDYASGLKEAPLFQSAIIFGSHQYVLQAQPSAEYWRTHISWVTWAAIIGGLSFTALFGAHLLMTSAHTHNVENLVRQRTAQLHDSENRLSTILNYAAEAILTCNANGLIQSANPSAENLFGLAPGGMRGRQLLSFFPDQTAQNLLRQQLSQVLPAELQLHHVNPERIEIQSQRQDGEILPLELAVTKVRLGQQTMLIIMLHDLSKTKRAERLKSEFVSAVSHELRTPLTSIRGVLGLLVGGVGEVIPPKTRGLLSMANENAIRLTKLINDLLDFDKLEYGGMQFDMQTYAVRTLVEKAITANQGYAENFRVHLHLLPDDTPGLSVVVDEGRFIQVLSNLISNAIKFSSENQDVEIAILQRTDWVRIEVRDRGIGIPDDFKDRIFHKFSQAEATAARKYAGTGLGLSLSKTLIEKMHGGIGFQSEIGVGSVFYLLLPAVRADEAAAEQSGVTSETSI